MLSKPTQMVKQQGQNDCYLACMCMVLGITYEEITQRLGSEFVARLQTHGTYGEDIEKLHASLGLMRGRDFLSIYRHSGEKIIAKYGSSADFARGILWGRRALVQVDSVNDNGGQHMVYWDGFEMFDPSNRQLHRWDTLEPRYITLFNERPDTGPKRLPVVEDADDAS